ncbi:ribonuclease HI family protein [candidate division WOR-3 bacterium]|uniref:Ribonuclease HI family protein n=1 Tax=candidate division WOR-3 bacterium TaxID=2052148 RepID=A0A937XCF3_UNCW3|nr:ribonuclease HI family protein [candidate division WOR-3 bacterium]
MRSLRPDSDRRPGIVDPKLAGFLVQIDGSSLGNPGPAGIGVRITRPDGTVLKEISRFIGIRTNNQAEYEGLLCALSESSELGTGSVIIRTDSELVYFQMAGRYKVKNPELRQLHSRAREIVLQLPNVSIQLVRREQNKETDRLAKAAAQAADNRPGHGRT